MADMCRANIRLGVLEIAFTEHLDPVPIDICFEKYDPAAYFASIEACRAEFGPQGLLIKAGIEVGEMHLYRDQVQTILEAYPYDVVLGSLHWNRGRSIFDDDYFKEIEPRTAAQRYFEELAELVEGGGFNIMSHLDVFKRRAFNVYGHFDITEYEPYVRRVFEACIRRGIAPEINVSGLNMPVKQTHPPVEAIHWYREMGGELLSIGSDSHSPQHIGLGLITEGVKVAKAAGFTRLTRFSQRKIEGFVEI